MNVAHLIKMELMAIGALNFPEELQPTTMCHLNETQFQDAAFCSLGQLPQNINIFPSAPDELSSEPLPLELSDSLAAHHQRSRNGTGNTYLPMVFTSQSTADVTRNLVATDPAFPITYCEAVYKKSCSSENTLDQASEEATCSISNGQMKAAEKQKLINHVFDTALNKYMLQYLQQKDVVVTSENLEKKPASIGLMHESMEEKNFTCSTCGESYKRRESLKRHVLSHTGEKPFICPVCNVKFCRKCQLTRHILVHTQEKPYECPDCGVKFRDKGNLNTHQLMHTGEKPFCCTVCKVRFRDRSNLKRHFLTHEGDKRFQCVLCSAKFKRKGDLKTHMLSHTGEKPFSCYICGTRFVVKSSLNKHLFTHTGTKPFKCSICGVAFQQLRYLKRHSALHTEEQPLDFSIRTQQ